MTSALFPDLVINGEHVPHAQVAAETQNQSAPQGKPGIAWRKATNAMAIRTLLLQEARSRDVAVCCQEVGPGRFETKEEALIRGLLEQAVDVVAPSEGEIRAEWEKDPERFRTSPLWEVSHILCACDPGNTVARSAALTRARDLLAQVQDNPKTFGQVAARESACGSRTVGGVLGQVGPNDTVPEFEAALRHLKSGEIAPEPVLTRHGYHIIRMDAVAEGRVLPFHAVRAKISDAMEKAAWARQSRDLIQRLIKTADIQGADLTGT